MHLNVTYFCTDTDGIYHIGLWAMTSNSTEKLDFLLGFDPSIAFHTYTLLVNEEDSDVQVSLTCTIGKEVQFI